MRVEIIRLYQTPIEQSKQTEGILYIIDDNKIIFECKTLELPWLDNQTSISCIPVGTYSCIKRHTASSKFKYEHFNILDVPNRSYILIHKGNYYIQIEGCILVGDNYTDINGDGVRDVTNSSQTLEKMLDILPDEFEINIKWRL